MNDNYKTLTRKMDTCGAVERAERRERILKRSRQAQADLNEATENFRSALQAVRKSEEQTPQEVPAASPQAHSRGLRSYDPARHRDLNVQRALADPLVYFFLTRNVSVETA